MPKKLKSEQLPTDGRFKMIDYLDKANSRLRQLGKHGKRATLKRTGNSVVLQFNWDGQVQRSPNCSFTKQGINEAEKIAALVTNQLVANQYSDKWLDNVLGKSNTSEQKKELLASEMISEYKTYWFKEHENIKDSSHSWYASYRHIEQIFGNLNEEIHHKLIQNVISLTQVNSFTRTTTLNGLTNLLDYFKIDDFRHLINQCKKNNKPEKTTKHVPNDNEIINVFNFGFKIKKHCPKKYRYRYPQWQFLYGLLATYGLRIHEAWNIANWDKPVILKDGDWVEIDLEDESGTESNFALQYRGNNEVIPAITDPDNQLHILAIKHDTKTGYRMAMPLSPNGHNWLKEFDLIGDFRLPYIESPMTRSHGTSKASHATVKWFFEHDYGFTAHALRHAYNHRAHQQGLNPKLIADSLGHGLQMNQSTYLKHMNNSRKVQMMKQAIGQVQNEQSELEILREENKHLREEVKQLRTELQMYKSLQKT